MIIIVSILHMCAMVQVTGRPSSFWTMDRLLFLELAQDASFQNWQFLQEIDN